MVYDFKLDENEDLYIDPDLMDFVISPSEAQHKKDILQTVPGWIKEFPLVGLNPYKYLNGKVSKQDLIRDAATQFKGDGYIVPPGSIDIDLLPTGELKINTLDIYR